MLDLSLLNFEATNKCQRLELRGHHQFSSYALIDDDGVRAQSYAVFPGLRGRAYRALVIGTRAHRVIVRRLLRRVAGAASTGL